MAAAAAAEPLGEVAGNLTIPTNSPPAEGAPSIHIVSPAGASSSFGSAPISAVSTSFVDPSRPRSSAASVAGHEEPGSPDSLTSSSTISTATSSSNPSGNHNPNGNHNNSAGYNHTPIVPQYPYNVSMPQFQGTVLPYERAPMPDDNDVQTRLPSICVDYLSHDWDESDVWASWKAMTRHKNELVNGLRLENASWRTWAKQRSNLKTISPETLNWLKDSDVTWLYGPLHTAVDPVPPPKLSTLQDRLSLDTNTKVTPAFGPHQGSPPSSAPASRPTSAMAQHRPCKTPGKPILKHRSLSEILGVPKAAGQASPVLEQAGSVDEEPSSPEEKSKLTSDQTKPDPTPVTGQAGQWAGNLGAPPAPSLRGRAVSIESSGTSGEDSEPRSQSRSCSRSRQASSGEEEGSRKKNKHISFSHRVEQCIAVDSSEEERGFWGRGGRGGSDDDDDDEDDEEDDMLVFRTSSAARRQRHAIASRSMPLGRAVDDAVSAGAGLSGMGPGTGNAGPVVDPKTIARMAPTTLKSVELYPAPSPAVVYEDELRDWHRSGGGDGSGASLRSGSASSSSASATSTLKVSDGERSQERDADPDDDGPPGDASQRNWGVLASSYPRNYGSGSGNNNQSVSLNSSISSYSTGGGSNTSLAGAAYAQTQPSYSSVPAPGSHTQWDDEQEVFTSLGFDYLGSPDPGVGDEYDAPSLPSQHLASGPASSATYVSRGSRSGKETSAVTPDTPNNRLPRPRETMAPPGEPPRSILKPPGVGVGTETGTGAEAAPCTVPQPVNASRSSPPSHPALKVSLPQTQPYQAAAAEPEATSPGLDRPDRRSRGRSSSRGSSASSFERSTNGTGRHASNSPSLSPPNNLGAQVNSAVSRMGSGGRLSRQGSSSSLQRSSSSATLVAEGSWRGGGGAGSIDGADEAAPEREGTAFAYTRSGKGWQARNGSEAADPRANHAASSLQARRDHSSRVKDTGSSTKAKAGDGARRELRVREMAPPLGAVAPAPATVSDSSDGAGDEDVATHPTAKSSLPPRPGATALKSSKLISAPKPASTRLADESDKERLFESPLMPPPPAVVEISSGVPHRTSSVSSISSLKWSDELLVSSARRSLLRHQSPRSSPVFRGTGRRSEDGAIGRGGSLDSSRRLSGDDFGFGYGYGDDEDGGLVDRMTDIVGSARELVGALWTVGSRSLWGRGGTASGAEAPAPR